MKPMFINGDGNWVKLLPGVLKIHNNKYHSTIKMTPTQASKNPESVTYEIESNPKMEARFKVGDYVRNADKRNVFSKDYTSNWNRELFKINKVLNSFPTTYLLEDINGEVIEGKYYEQELFKSSFDFDSNIRTLRSMGIKL